MFEWHSPNLSDFISESETLFHCVLTALPARILEPPCFLVYLDVICLFLFWNPSIPGILSCSVFMTVGSGVVCVVPLYWASAKNIPVRISIFFFLHLVREYVCVPLLEVKFGYWIFLTNWLFIEFWGVFLFSFSLLSFSCDLGCIFRFFSKHSTSAFVFLCAGVF